MNTTEGTSATAVGGSALSEGLGAWLSVATMPRDSGSYLVADAKRGIVVPYIRGVIHNNTGTAHDWQYCGAITHWMPLPAPPQVVNDAPNTELTGAERPGQRDVREKP